MINHSNKIIREYRGVWVLVEQRDGSVSQVTYELLGEGRRLADALQTELCAVIMGCNISEIASNLIAYGADKVYMFEHECLRFYSDEIYTHNLTQIINKYKPEILLIGASIYGRSLAPRVASRVGTGLTADCTSLDINRTDRLLLQTRPAFSGNLMATVICPEHRPQIATIRQGIMKPGVADYTRKGWVEACDIEIPEKLNVVTMESTNINRNTNSLDKAEFIISIGRGIGGSQNITIAQKIASEMGAAFGASRPLVDAGWIGYEHQIGQTGKTVRPKLYIACGISGAIQHLAGINSSDVIVAINIDPEAPIFKVAKYGIVGDILEVLPAITKHIKEKKRVDKNE